MKRRYIAVALLIGVIIVSGGTYLSYSRDMQTIHDRLYSGSQVIQTQHGSIEYAEWGDGPAVLVVHGAGGGYDQGNLIARAFGGEGFRWIVPSRFGYLRSPMPADASTAAQAEAFAELLDKLGIERVAVIGFSGGVPPSLQFAQRYPERTSALVLLSSAPYTPLTAAEQKLPVPVWIYQALFSSDFPYWLLKQVSSTSLEPIFDVTPELRANLTPEERVFVAEMIDVFQPVTERINGVRNEGAAIDPNACYIVDEITTPALVIHSRDDHINPFAFGEYTAQHLRNVQFMPLTTGGHLLLGHQAEVRTRMNAFLKQYVTAAK